MHSLPPSVISPMEEKKQMQHEAYDSTQHRTIESTDTVEEDATSENGDESIVSSVSTCNVSFHSEHFNNSDGNSKNTKKCHCAFTPTPTGPHIICNCTWSDLHIRNHIGSGSFAMVLKASYNRKHQDDKNRTTTTVAVKCLKEGTLDSRARGIAMEDLREEARILTTLNHPNIVKIHALARPGHRFFFVMELLEEGETLSTRIRRWAKQQQHQQQQRGRGIRHRRGRCRFSLWPPHCLTKRFRSNVTDVVPSLYKRLFNIAFKLSKAVNYLHKNRIVHCDLKPANIGFDRETGAVQLFDFGLSQDLASRSLTIPGKEHQEDSISGSYRYMAPEIMEGKPMELSADIYSFAMLLWELVTLERPHHQLQEEFHRDAGNGGSGDIIANLTNRVVHQNCRPSLDQISLPRLRQLLEDCWQPDPLDRLTSEELVKGLMRVLAAAAKSKEQQPEEKEHQRLLNSSGGQKINGVEVTGRGSMHLRSRPRIFWTERGARQTTLSSVTNHESTDLDDFF